MTAQPDSADAVVAEYRSYANPVYARIMVNGERWQLARARMLYRLILERQRVKWFGGEFNWQKIEQQRSER